jgi:primosomal protein N' (replication factor Y)
LRPDLVLHETLVRMDSDSMQHIDHFHTVLAAFQRGDIRVLLGTQMIAKGLDVPGVRLVGVIDADTAMHLPDFRAAERTFQLVSQVTGRCGRGEGPGRAIVQTMDPDAPSIVQAAGGHTEAFLNSELDMRRDAALPPITRMARVLVQHEDLSTCEQLADRLAAGLRAVAPDDGHTLGPMACPLPRLRRRFRRETLLTHPTAHGLQTWLHRALAERMLLDPAILVDVDPVSLL